jgi:hypothetical protein
MQSLIGKKRMNSEIVQPIAIYPRNLTIINSDLFEPRPEIKFRIPTESSLGHINKYKAVEFKSKTEEK